MSRKDIIVISVLINAGLLTILLISALTTKESYFVASSAKVAGTILENDQDGMMPKVEVVSGEKIQTEEKLEISSKDENISKKEPIEIQEDVSSAITKELLKQADKEEIVHKLPSIALEPKVEIKEKNRFMEVTVQKGDTLEKIARLNNVSVSDIIKINELPNSFLRIGQLLLIPKKDGKNKVSAPVKTGPNYYTVKCGDNPWTIAMKHHMKVSELLKLNNLDNKTAKRLRPGDKLKIR